MQVGIWRSDDGWRWRIWSANGRIVAVSGEAYVTKANARRAYNRMIELVKAS